MYSIGNPRNQVGNRGGIQPIGNPGRNNVLASMVFGGLPPPDPRAPPGSRNALAQALGQQQAPNALSVNPVQLGQPDAPQSMPQPTPQPGPPPPIPYDPSGIKALGAPDYSPVQHPLQMLARALNPIAANYQQGQNLLAERAQKDAQMKALAQAVSTAQGGDAAGAMSTPNLPPEAGMALLAQALKPPEKPTAPREQTVAMPGGDFGNLQVRQQEQNGRWVDQAIMGREPPPAAAPSTNVRDYEYAKGQGFQGTFEQWQQQQRAPGTQVTTNVNSGTTPGGGKRYEELNALARTARANGAENQALTQLLDAGVRTGFGADFEVNAKNAARALGLDFGNASGQELFRAISSRMILPQVKQLGNNPTDTDLKMIAGSNPNLQMSPQGNRTLLQLLDLSNQRAIALADFSRQYWQRPGAMTDGGFADQARYDQAEDQFVVNSPLWGQAVTAIMEQAQQAGAPPPPPPPPPAPQQTQPSPPPQPQTQARPRDAVPFRVDPADGKMMYLLPDGQLWKD
jgi:hypothetical protein